VGVVEVMVGGMLGGRGLKMGREAESWSCLRLRGRVEMVKVGEEEEEEEVEESFRRR